MARDRIRDDYIPTIAYGWLLRRVRETLLEATQAEVARGADVSIGTIANAENGEGVNVGKLTKIAGYLSAALEAKFVENRDSDRFDANNHPKLAWLLRRLRDDIDAVLGLDDVVLNGESRFLVDEYRIGLTVWPCPGRQVEIAGGEAPPERFNYDDLARVKCDVKFSQENRRMGSGFEMSYGTVGRIKVLAPDDVFYRRSKTFVTHAPDLRRGRDHSLEMVVVGGFGPGNETAHFKIAQPATYRKVAFDLDLMSYPAAAIEEEPEVRLVQVLHDRPFDCCDIAKGRKGVRLEPDKSDRRTSKWTWTIRGDLRDLMICVHWKINRDRLPEGGGPPDEMLKDLTQKLIW